MLLPARPLLYPQCFVNNVFLGFMAMRSIAREDIIILSGFYFKDYQLVLPPSVYTALARQYTAYR